jgi:type III secretion system (T3SS) SseB-like protein
MDVGGAIDFQPENELEQAMLEALVDPARMPAFHEALGEGALLLPVRGGSAAQDPRAVDLRGPMRFTTVTYQGRVGVPAFTSVTQMSKVAPPNSAFVEMSGRLLAAGWDDETTLLVNPGGDLGLPIGPEVIRGWRPKPVPP